MASGISEVNEEFKKVKAPTLPTSQQQIASQAFESSVSPLRSEFQERLKGTTESLAQKGISFGGVGGEGLRDVFKEQQRVEGQIASSLGSQLGKSALDQAFSASEAAKNRILQRDLQKAGFKFQKGEAQLGREFTGEESRLGRQFAGEQAQLGRESAERQAQAGREFEREQSQLGRSFAGEQAQLERGFTGEQARAGREFVGEQAQLGREFTSEQQQVIQQFQASQAELGREFTSDEADRARDFVSSEAVAGRDFSATQTQLAQQFQSEENALGRTFSSDEAERQRNFGLTAQEIANDFAREENALGRTFSSDEAERQRNFGLTTQEIANDFAREENALGRTFSLDEAERQRNFGLTTQEIANDFAREESLFNRTFNSDEAEKQREFQTAFQEAGFEFETDQRALDRQDQINENALQLALSGNLSGDEIDNLFEETFGEGVTFTTQDEQDMQRVATASGLSVDEYLEMRQVIGQGQLRDVLENPQDYITSPGSLRDFQLQLAQMQADAQVEIAEEESDTGVSVLCTELHNQGLLPTDIYKADSLYAKQILPSVIRGYHLWGIPLAKLMKKSRTLTIFLQPLISSWAHHMAFKMGVCNEPNLVGYLLESFGVPICRIIGNITVKKGVANG